MTTAPTPGQPVQLTAPALTALCSGVGFSQVSPSEVELILRNDVVAATVRLNGEELRSLVDTLAVIADGLDDVLQPSALVLPDGVSAGARGLTVATGTPDA